MRSALLLICSLGLVVGCSPDNSTTPAGPTTPVAPVTPETIAIDSLALQAGDSTLPAIRVTIAGVTRAALPAELTVTSSDTSVLIIDSNDALIAVGDGLATVTVAWTAAPTLSVSRTFSVLSERLATVTVTAPAILNPGDSAAVTVQGTIRGGRIVSQPSSVQITSNNPGIARIDDASVVAMTVGSTWLVATTATGIRDSTFITVNPGAAAHLVLGTHAATMAIGDQLQPSAVVTDHLGNLLTNPPLSWSSTVPAIATVTSSGMVTALESGSAQVIASTGSVADTLVITVLAPVLQQLIVTPGTLTLNAGATAQLSVQALDTRGNTMTPPALTWTSHMAGVTVSASGLVQAAASVATSTTAGTVQVASGAVVGYVSVNTIAAPPPPPPPSGYVQIRWVGTAPSASVAAAFTAAQARINGLFLSFSGVAAMNPNIPANYCLGGTPATNETVPGIIIYAQVTPIDGVGNILGSAGPCLLRSGNFLPVVAEMQFDSADMDAMVANGTLNGVVLHEMMHTLGFGTIWQPGLQDEVASPGGADPEYFGTAAQAAYAALGVSAASGVPVENTGGLGTEGSHWRESVFHTELMTGWADGSMPMSRVTIGALRDFGYDVDLSKADPFTLSTSLVAGDALRAATPIVEVNRSPIGVVDATGRITPWNGTIAH